MRFFLTYPSLIAPNERKNEDAFVKQNKEPFRKCIKRYDQIFILVELSVKESQQTVFLQERHFQLELR
uniref:Uncharacterized protein n=1 Tax=Loa loa TaxID=7209 RepID=A0A1I7VZC8_LOALO